MRRFLVLFVLVPLAMVAIVLSVANRGSVTLSLDPFGGASPRWAIELPLFVVLFVTLAVGVVIGGIATWTGQGRWRKAARAERANAARLRQDLERVQGRITTMPTLVAPLSDRGRDAA